MWIVRWIFWILALLFLILFATQNATETVNIEFFKWQTKNPLPLWMVMYLSFLVGIVVWFIGSIFKIVQLKTEVRKTNKENQVLKKELDELRNIPIEEEPDSDEIQHSEIM
ncbi:LapA family protein [candidate division KSB1 bacterium]|nr:LapA family protein [candidate division KSB1 bacterium]